MLSQFAGLFFVACASISGALERARKQRFADQNDCSKNYVAKRQRHIIAEFNA
jgi:hypothetical protein